MFRTAFACVCVWLEAGVHCVNDERHQYRVRREYEKKKKYIKEVSSIGMRALYQRPQRTKASHSQWRPQCSSITQCIDIVKSTCSVIPHTRSVCTLRCVRDIISFLFVVVVVVFSFFVSFLFFVSASACFCECRFSFIVVTVSCEWSRCSHRALAETVNGFSFFFSSAAVIATHLSMRVCVPSRCRCHTTSLVRVRW